MTSPNDPILRTCLAGIDLVNPVLLAAGTAGVLDDLAGVLDLARVGALVTKSITPQPRDGNPTHRVIPTSVGMLNSIGLANPGMDAFAESIAPRAASLPCPVIGSIAGFSIDDYLAVAAVMEAAPHIPAAELNVSCPNVHGGCDFASDPKLLADLCTAVRPVLTTTKMIIKLSPVVIGTPHSIVDLARAAIDAGADALTLSNTVPAMAIDIDTRKPRLANITGGLSGPAIHPVVVKLVYEVYTGIARDASIPIIAAGGVNRWQPAAEFILAGAAAVQVGTASLADPRAAIKVAKGLAHWAHKQHASNITDLVGAIQL